jgi:hypothetical protein
MVPALVYESGNLAIAASKELYADWNGTVVTDATNDWFAIIALDFSRNSKKAGVTAT